MNMHTVMDDPRRRQRWCLLKAWRALRLSVVRGRPMTLPNLLRLHQRICNGSAPPKDLRRLRSLYLQSQPFHRIPPVP